MLTYDILVNYKGFELCLDWNTFALLRNLPELHTPYLGATNFHYERLALLKNLQVAWDPDPIAVLNSYILLCNV